MWKNKKIPVFFHRDQLAHKPLFEWSFGEKIDHPETTSRAESILTAIQARPQEFEVIAPTRFPISALRETHNANLLKLYQTAMTIPQDRTFYPSVFPKRDRAKADPTNIYHAGYYCLDSGTPLNATTWSAAAWSAACAMEAAEAIEKGHSHIAYALCRPPGHHASKNLFGGYCYFNNAAIAANRLKKSGKVMILDIDFHHGNGTQSLFYRDPQVYVVSVHGDPKEFYPFFWGHAEERGAGPGEGFNLNLPLQSRCDGEKYLEVLKSKVFEVIQKFNPKFLIVSLGLDTYVSDPVGAFSLETVDYQVIGSAIAGLDYNTVVIQEGGYASESLGENAAAFLEGFL